MPRQHDEFMTTQEVADLLRLSGVQHLYDMRWKGTGPRAAKIGRELRYRRSDVDAWIDEQYAQTGQN
jgi:excisionase family DNA binding protein